MNGTLFDRCGLVGQKLPLATQCRPYGKGAVIQRLVSAAGHDLTRHSAMHNRYVAEHLDVVDGDVEVEVLVVAVPALDHVTRQRVDDTCGVGIGETRVVEGDEGFDIALKHGAIPTTFQIMNVRPDLFGDVDHAELT